MDRINQHQDTAKHIVDAVAIPGGLLAGVANYMDIVNGAMTFLVLLTSLIWGVYRIIDMRNTQRRTKRVD
jgi:hypothetical protein